MSIWTDGLPAWWAMVVAVAALLVGVWLGELHGRGVGRAQEREDCKAARAARQFRRIPHVPPHERPRGERTAAFLNAPEVHHEELVAAAAEMDRFLYGRDVAHEAWLAHTEQAMDVANGTVLAPEDQALLDELVAGLDAWRAANL